MSEKKVTVTFRIDEDKLKMFDDFAKTDERDRSFLLNEAVDQYLEARTIQLARIAEGIKKADDGDLLEHVEVMAGLRDRKPTS